MIDVANSTRVLFITGATSVTLKMNHRTRFAETKECVCFYKQLGCTSACVTERVCYSSLCVLESLGRFLMSGAKMPQRCYSGNILIVIIN